jgi:glycosyltransferase involved in cell wall biosynthesis
MNVDQLRVAINAHLVSFEQTYRNAGVSRYTYTLLDGLSRSTTPQHYTVFVNRAALGTAAVEALTASGKIEVVAGSTLAERPVQRVLWEQTQLPAELRRGHIEVFHSPVNVLPMRLPCPSVVTILDLAFMHFPQYFRPTRRMYQRTFTTRSVRRATRVVTIAESTKRDLLERFGAASERVRVIYPAIDAEYQPVNDPDIRASFRSRHQLPERYILYLGTLEPRKNLLTLVEAYAKLRALSPDTPPLVIAGAKGWYYQAVFDRVRSLGLERSVTFAGYVSREDQPLWYSCADLFVYPSFFEGFGLPVVEALACGTPTVTSNVSSLPEAGGGVALLVDPGSQDALAHAMHGVLSDPAVRSRTEEDGPRWARQFSPARMAAEYADVYREAAEAGNVGVGKRGR